MDARKNAEPTRSDGKVRWCGGEDLTGMPMVHTMIPRFLGDCLKAVAQEAKVPYQALIEGVLSAWLCDRGRAPAELAEISRQVRAHLGLAPALKQTRIRQPEPSRGVLNPHATSFGV